MARLLSLLVLVAALGVGRARAEGPAASGITQVATIDALLAGVYEGHLSLAELRPHGDFGLGTYEHLDGEMILLDGVFYQARVDGRVYRPDPTVRTPFACVTHFAADLREELTGPLDLAGLEARVDARVPEPNRFVALQVRGLFGRVQVRSVPAQERPYPPLVEVTPHQAVFVLNQVRGTLLGFRSPPFTKGVNVPGYHLHFLSDDQTAGGHVLEFELLEGALQADTRHEWLNLYLPPDSAAFAGADLARDQSQSLQTVEKGPGAAPR